MCILLSLCWETSFHSCARPKRQTDCTCSFFFSSSIIATNQPSLVSLLFSFSSTSLSFLSSSFSRNKSLYLVIYSYSCRFYFFLLFIINLSHLSLLFCFCSSVLFRRVLLPSLSLFLAFFLLSSVFFSFSLLLISLLFLPSNSTLSLIPSRSFSPPLFATSPSRTSPLSPRPPHASSEPLHACTAVQFPRPTDNPIYTSDYSRGGFEPHPIPNQVHVPTTIIPAALIPSIYESRNATRGEIYFLSLSLYERLKHGRFPASTFTASWCPPVKQSQDL